MPAITGNWTWCSGSTKHFKHFLYVRQLLLARPTDDEIAKILQCYIIIILFFSSYYSVYDNNKKWTIKNVRSALFLEKWRHSVHLPLVSHSVYDTWPVRCYTHRLPLQPKILYILLPLAFPVPMRIGGWVRLGGWLVDYIPRWHTQEQSPSQYSMGST